MNARFLTRLNARSQFLYVLGVLFVIVALSLIFANLAVGLAVLLLGLVIAVAAAIARSRRRRRARSA
jgi:energy-coupling factor transporter transmembrane protein EcfT